MLMIALAACSGSSTDTPTDAPEHTDDTDDTDDTDGSSAHSGTSVLHTAGPEPYEATWAGMERLFEDHCDVCHPSQAGFNLHVAIPADIANATGRYVVPGDAQASSLWRSVSDQGVDMPLGGLLPLETVDPVRVWIEAGAVVP
ncbi:MAG: hypothetical protein KC621_15430 [Myxococcales bacterium]|nr:hypothetical protein [Myxococcales bacterium]